jgi:acyl-coenzyme A thioesterase PaaI-like protein
VIVWHFGAAWKLPSSADKSMSQDEPFQSQLGDNHCFGCGPNNEHGLQLQSFWGLDGVAVAQYQPGPQHSAAPKHLVNGGVIATLVDCHGVCTAMAAAYRRANRPIGSSPALSYATGSMTVNYLRPTPMGASLDLEARVTDADAKQSLVEVKLSAAGKICVQAIVTAVRVPESWLKQA